jgi:hypothetical protein
VINNIRNHVDTLLDLYRTTDDPDLAGDIYAELAEIDREARQDPTLYAELYGDED